MRRISLTYLNMVPKEMAFEKAWKDLRESNQSTVTLAVPPNKTFLLHQISFQGPCKAQSVNIKIDGTLLAPKRDAWKVCTKRWLYFFGVRGMTLSGSGQLNGQGSHWWNALNTSSCKGIPTVRSSSH
ncbi:hypothetical protein VNO77_30395 [Canavalia gladiata]|uniref:Polygalacturonase n=1 Tax=Canavalia gladiata TaxID=3824 RepID=A0AAN9Q383_CANGL